MSIDFAGSKGCDGCREIGGDEEQKIRREEDLGSVRRVGHEVLAFALALTTIRLSRDKVVCSISKHKLSDCDCNLYDPAIEE